MPYRVTADPRQEAQPADDSELCVDFMDAIGADVAPLEGHDVFGVAAEHAGGLILFQNNGVILDEDLERIAVSDFQGTAQFNRQDNAAKAVNFADDTG